MRYFASNTIQYPANKNIRNDACSFSVSVNSDLPFMSTEFPTVNLTNKQEMINPMIAQVMIIMMLKLMQLIIKINNIKVKNK